MLFRSNDLAILFYSKGEYDRALPLYEECLAKNKRVLGDDHPNTLASLNNLAELFRNKGEYEVACVRRKRRHITGWYLPDCISLRMLLSCSFSSRACSHASRF